MAYIDLYEKNMLDVVSLGRTINNFNQELGDYIRVDILDPDGINKGSLYSNRILFERADTPGVKYLKDYHYHPEKPEMGFCVGRSHNPNRIEKLNPISVDGTVIKNLSITDQYKKQVDIYKDDTGQIYLKPKQLVEKISGGMKLAKRGKYRMRVHFMRDVKSELGIFLSNMKFNLIENGNFFAGLEATQTGDLDRSSGKNNIIMMSNPGFSKFVLNQNGLPGNKYSLKVTGIKPNTNYIFSCWVAWDPQYAGGKQLGTFREVNSQASEDHNPTIGLKNLGNTTPAGSFYNDEGNSTVNVRSMNGLTWKKLYKFIATDNHADTGYMMINLGLSEGTYYPTTSPLSNRYFTDLRLEKVHSFEGETIMAYLNKLYNDSEVVYLLKKDSLVGTNRDIRTEGEVGPVVTNTPIFTSAKQDATMSELEDFKADLELDVTSYLREVLPQLFPSESDDEAMIASENDFDNAQSDNNNMMYKRGGKIKPKVRRR